MTIPVARKAVVEVKIEGDTRIAPMLRREQAARIGYPRVTIDVAIDGPMQRDCRCDIGIEGGVIADRAAVEVGQQRAGDSRVGLWREQEVRDVVQRMPALFR